MPILRTLKSISKGFIKIIFEYVSFLLAGLFLGNFLLPFMAPAITENELFIFSTSLFIIFFIITRLIRRQLLIYYLRDGHISKKILTIYLRIIQASLFVFGITFGYMVYTNRFFE